MPSIHMARLTLTAAVLMAVPPPATAQPAPAPAEQDRARTAFLNGDTAGALALIEDALTHSPDDPNALFFSALINFRMGNVDAARGRLERAVSLAGNYFAAWELMVQVTQTQGDLARRDEAIDRLKLAISTAIDPDIRQKDNFIRDRIRAGDQVVWAIDYFQRSGTDFTRYRFALDNAGRDPSHGLLLRTDANTTETWATTALLPPEKPLFHLDLVDRAPQGADRVTVYQYYVGQPDYDTVRSDVMKILRGELRPLSGEPGTMSGILK
jgi:tetratricopeptide (TPR) repeat protein